MTGASASGTPDVTVVVPVYGSYDRRDVLDAVVHRWTVQACDPAVVVSEQNRGDPRFERLARRHDARHVQSKPDVDGDVRYNIGRIRNVAVAAAETDRVYVTDADVFPTDARYLDRLAAWSRNRDCLGFRPGMYRLLEDSHESFLNDYGRSADPVPTADADFCLSTYRDARVEPFDGDEIEREIDGWTHVCTRREAAYLDSDDFDPDDEDELVMKPRVHWGGTWITRRAWQRVGGYCEAYYDWGCEDDDFHMKLAAAFDLEPIPHQALVHFEHARDYADGTFQENETFLDRRREQSLDELVDADAATDNSFFADWLDDASLDEYVHDADRDELRPPEPTQEDA